MKNSRSLASQLLVRTFAAISLGVIAVLFANLSPSATFAEEIDVVTVGVGGYRTTLPKLCKPLPDTLYRTSDVTGPMLTHQWWSSLVWQKFSQNMFPHPLCVRCDTDGLMVAYPGGNIHGDKSGIFGDADLKNGDFKIGHSTVKDFPAAKCGGYSDWFVTAVFEKEKASLRTSFGHGSPFVYCMFQEGDPQITFTKLPTIWYGKATDPILGITVNGHHYGLFGATGSTWTGLDGLKFTNQSRSKSHFSIAVLPNDNPETLRRFAKHSHAHVTDTQVSYGTLSGKIISTYRFTCTPREGDEKSTIFALYPHQWKYETNKEEYRDILSAYNSVRGYLYIRLGDHFTTEVPIQGVLPYFPKEGIPDRERMLGYLKDEAAKPKPGFGDTYSEGKHLGTLASLSGIAEAAAAPELQQLFITELKRRLESWLTATPRKDQPVFYYNKTWGTLVGSRPSFGSDFPLNDHHFHYGYFIRAAAEVARVDPDWAKKWGPMVNLLIRDIASPDRNDKMFPHLRCFDKYAGHSWASGDANFADGNNQESSSESLNAWYGMILWGEATGDKAIRDTGLYLFNTERTAIEEYWFDVDGTNFPKTFPNVALGMIWGGKGAFGTWFSADIDCIHGINWLPYTPASLYMGRHPDYVKKNHERIVSVRKGGGDYKTGWGDLVVMFSAMHDPTIAVKYLDENPNCKVEGGNTRAFMAHWIHTLDKLGHVDGKTTCDYPFANVFIKGNDQTYVAYNFGEKPLTIVFSDKIKLEIAPHSMATKTLPIK